MVEDDDASPRFKLRLPTFVPSFMSFSGFDEAAGFGWEPAPQAGDLIKDALRKEQLLK